MSEFFYKTSSTTEDRGAIVGLQSTPRSSVSLTVKLIGSAAIVAIFFLVALPTFHSTRRGRRHPCLSHLRQLSIAIINYEATHGHYPPAYVTDDAGQPMHSWRVLILPFLDDPKAQQLYDSYRFDEPWNGPNNHRLARKMPKVFRCPDEISPNDLHTSYVAIVADDGMWPNANRRLSHEISDGTSQTILLVEQPMSGIPWMEPRDVELHDVALTQADGPRNHTGGGATCAFADGHTQHVVAISPEDLQILRTVAGSDRFLLKNREIIVMTEE